MTRNELSEVVYETLQQLCEIADVEITDACNPFEDLGLDSQDGIELACEISEKAGRLFPNDQNPFVDDLAGRVRTVGEIIDLLVDIQADLEPLVIAGSN